MKKVFAFAILMSMAQLINAQQVCWCKFEVTSQNKQFVASITPSDNSVDNPNWKTDWRIRVYKVNEGNNTLIWESKYVYSGKSIGTLSDDGQYFTYVEDWYYRDLPLLTIYKNGQKIVSNIDGNSLSISRKKLKKTSLHYLWLSQLDIPYQYKMTANRKTYLILRTIDNKEFTVNLDMGTFMKKS